MLKEDGVLSRGDKSNIPASVGFVAPFHLRLIWSMISLCDDLDQTTEASLLHWLPLEFL